MAALNEPDPVGTFREDDGESRLWYADPVGSEVIRRLEGDYRITGASGLAIVIDASSLGQILLGLEFVPTRTGKTIRALRKKKAVEPGRASTALRPEPTAK